MTNVEYSTLTLAEYFAGIGGVSTGAKLAGVKPVYACEFDANDQNISYFYKNVHKLNDPDQVFDMRPIRQVENAYPATIAHFSPSCRSFSTNHARSETDVDIANARKIAELAIQYPWVTLEQVAGYLSSHSYQIIRDSLFKNEYRITTRVVNMSSYGVPQNRNRLWLIATREPGINPIIPYNVPPHINTWDNAIGHLLPNLEPWPNVPLGYRKRLIKTKRLHPDATSFLVAKSGLMACGNNRPCFTLRRIFSRVNCENAARSLSYVNPQGKWFDAKTLEIFRILSGFPDSWKTFDSPLNFAGFGDCVPPLFYQQLLAANF